MEAPALEMHNQLSRLCEKHQLKAPNLAEALKASALHFQLLLKWNRKISLSSITEPAAAARFHYFETLWASQFIDAQIKVAADIGSGAGFPGVPLALLNPQIHFHLIEADRRKATFLNEVRRLLAANNITVINQRFEQVDPNAQLIMVRALERFDQQMEQILSFAEKAQQVMLFLAVTTAQQVIDKLTIISPQRQWQAKVMVIPESDNRAILLLS